MVQASHHSKFVLREAFQARASDDARDVRDIQKRLKASGVIPTTEADETTTGPGHFVVEDPDGNVILIDQHV